MKRRISLFIAVVILLGCASMEEERKAEINTRIVYRNLAPEPKPEQSIEPSIGRISTPRRQPVSPVPKVSSQIAEPPVNTPEKTIEKKAQTPEAPRYFVEFTNESATDFNRKTLKNFMGKTPKEASIMVVGHSHGISTIGTRRLATKRAETVRRYLIAQGYAKVHTMASWGRKTVSFAPDRGVYLFVLHTDTAQKEKEMRE